MVDIVGLRFVTEGQKEALTSLALYERGIRDLSNVQDRHVATMNRALTEEVRAFTQAYQRKQRFLQEEERAQEQAARAQQRATREREQTLAQEIRAFAQAQQRKERFLQEEARAQEQAAANARRWAASVDQALGVSGLRATELGATFSQLERVQENLALGARQWAAQLDQALGVAGRSAIEAGASFSALEAQQERLAMQFNPLYAASKQYERAVEDLNTALRIGVVTQAQYEGQLEMLNTQLALGMTNQRGLGAASQFASRGMNSTGMALQQVGYQAGDFLVQIQSGTNAFVAFGQQATQLVGILPMFGSVMGLSGTALVGLSAGLGIAIPLFTAAGAAFMRTRQAAAEAARGVDVFAERVANARRQMADMTFEVEALRRGFQDFGEFALVRAVEEAQTRVQELSAQIYELQQLGTVTGPNERALEAAREALRLANEQLEAYRQTRAEHDRLSDAEERRAQYLRDSATMAEQLRAAYETLRTVAEEAGDAFKQAYLDDAAAAEQKIQEAAEETQRAAEAARDLKIALDEAKREASRLAEADVKANIAAGADEALRLTANLQAAASALSAIAGATISANIRVVGARAQTQALQAGSDILGARAAGDIATERARLSSALGSGDAAVRAAAQVELQRFTEATQAATAAQRELDAAIAATRESGSSGSGSGAGSARELATLDSIVTSMMQRIESERELLGLFGDTRREREIALDLEQQVAQSGIETSEESIRAAAAQLAAQEQINEAMRQQQEFMEQLSSGLAGVFTDAITGAKSLQDGLRDLLRQMTQLFLNRAFSQFFESLIGGGPGAGGASGFLSFLFPRREMGGPVTAGQPYIVGERRAELFVPRENGTILPRVPTARGGSNGGGGTFVQVVNNSGQPSRQERARGPDGREIIRVIVGEEISGGGYDKQFGGRYGNRPAPVRR